MNSKIRKRFLGLPEDIQNQTKLIILEIDQLKAYYLLFLSRWYLRSKGTSKAFGTQISFIDTDAFLSNKRKKYCSISFNDAAFKTL